MRFWRKKKQEPTPLERLCATDPSFRDAPPAALFAADLCATEAGRRTETFLILTADDRLVIRESGKAERVLELKQLEHISSPGGVGSVEIIARTAGGEELLLARATAKCAPDAGGFVRAVNRRLRRMTGDGLRRGGAEKGSRPAENLRKIGAPASCKAGKAGVRVHCTDHPVFHCLHGGQPHHSAHQPVDGG